MELEIISRKLPEGYSLRQFSAVGLLVEARERARARDRWPPRLTAQQRKTRSTKRVAIAAFIAGATVSVVANLVAAEPTWLGRATSVWPALALLVTVHLYQHVPVTRNGWLGLLYKVSVASVIGVAAWVSYWHIVEVTLRAGESSLTAHLMPLTIDAMMAVASAVATYKPKPARKRRPAVRRPVASVTPLRAAR